MRNTIIRVCNTEVVTGRDLAVDIIPKGLIAVPWLAKGICSHFMTASHQGGRCDRCDTSAQRMSRKDDAV